MLDMSLELFLITLGVLVLVAGALWFVARIIVIDEKIKIEERDMVDNE